MDLVSSTSGSYDIAVFDDNNYQQMRKQSTDVKPLFTLPFRHQSPYNGPFVRTESAVMIAALILSYYAIALRFKILNKEL